MSPELPVLSEPYCERVYWRVGNSESIQDAYEIQRQITLSACEGVYGYTVIDYGPGVLGRPSGRLDRQYTGVERETEA